MEEHGGALFHIGPIEVSSVMTTTLAITVGLCVLALLTYRRVQRGDRVPQGLQNAMEKAIEMLDGFISSVIGKEMGRRYFHYLATLFFFILVCNYSGLLPMAGHLPGLAAPTSTLGVTVALAICTFFYTHYAGIQSHGLGYFKGFFKPVAFLFPLLVLEEFIRPLSLSIRLFGNIYGEEAVTVEIFNMVPLIAPLIMNVLSLLLCFVQAIVFVLLSSIYISGAAGEGH